MKKFYILCIVVLVLVQCSTYHRAEKNLVMGNFDAALDEMITKKSKGVKEKKYEQWVILFQQSYNKANANDLAIIQQASKDVESVNKYRTIFNRYQNLQYRQSKVSSLLPLYYNGKKVLIQTNDYSDKLAVSKQNLVNALVVNAQNNMVTGNKNLARNAYYNYDEVGKLMPFYENINQLKDEAYQRGLSHIKVSIHNYAPVFLPPNLEIALTDYSFMSNNKFWYRFYNDYSDNTNYDYEVELNFDQIFVSGEDVQRNRRKFEKEIKDGEEYLKDEEGEYVKDSLGKPVIIDKFVSVNARAEEVRLYKNSSLKAQLVIFKNGNVIQQFPLSSNFVFEDISARIYGDERAVDEDYLKKYKEYPANFPTSEQLVYDNGLQLKAQLRDIVNNYFK